MRDISLSAGASCQTLPGVTCQFVATLHRWQPASNGSVQKRNITINHELELTMKYKVSDFIIDRLYDWGVHRVFGYPGDAINPIVSSLGRKEGMEFVQVRHETNAAFMACAHSKFTGEVAVCMATAGPGAIQLLNGLYDAKMDHQSVVAIVGQQSRTAIGTSFLQDVDLHNLYKDVGSEYVNVANHPSQLRHLIDRAMRIARAERTVTCIIIPYDVQVLPAEPHPKREHGQSFSGIGYPAVRIVPSDEELDRAAQVLSAGRKVAMLVGAGALGATDEVIAVADLLGAGIAKALLGMTVVSDDLPYVTGSIGMLGTEATAKMMSECDTLLMVGTNFPYAEFLPREGQARGVQIDIDARNLSLRYPMEVMLQGDSRETLRALAARLVRKEDRQWRSQIEENVKAWWQVLEARAAQPAEPVNPQLLCLELSKVLPTNAIVTADSGTSTVWFARDLKLGSGMLASVSGGLASMGCAIPYAVAAKFAHPGRAAFVLVGDGAMQMSGNAELITIAKYWKDWIDPRLIVIVLNNQDLNFVTWEMRVMEGDPKLNASQDLPPFNYAGYADSLGLRGLAVRTPEDIHPALLAALASDRPAVIDVHSDPNIPPLSPHITLEEAKTFAESQLKGDPEMPKPMLSSLGQLWRSLFLK